MREDFAASEFHQPISLEISLPPRESFILIESHELPTDCFSVPRPTDDMSLHMVDPDHVGYRENDTTAPAAPLLSSGALRWAAAGRNFVPPPSLKRFEPPVKLDSQSRCPFCLEQFGTKRAKFVQPLHLKKHKEEAMWTEVWTIFDRTHQRKVCPWLDCQEKVKPGTGADFARHLASHGMAGGRCKVVDDGGVCNQVLEGGKVETHFQQDHGLVRATVRSPDVARLCPMSGCVAVLIGWPTICDHLETHLQVTLDAANTPHLEFPSFNFCPQCVADGDLETGSRLHVYSNVTQLAQHIVRKHLSRRPYETPTSCLHPQCSVQLSLAKLADHLFDEHRIRVTGKGKKVVETGLEGLTMSPDVRAAFERGSLPMCKPDW